MGDRWGTVGGPLGAERTWGMEKIMGKLGKNDGTKTWKKDETAMVWEKRNMMKLEDCRFIRAPIL